MKKAKNSIKIPSFRINDEIRINGDVRITGDDIETEVCDIKKAIKIAENKGLDLIEISPSANPPVVKVASYEKMLYSLKKIAKKNKPKTNTLKEIQLSVNIASHDLDTKAKHAREFLEDGDKVKVTLTMKGRELSRRDDNKKSLFEFINSLSDISTPEAFPKDEGNRTIVILKRKK